MEMVSGAALFRRWNFWQENFEVFQRLGAPVIFNLLR
jgi:hypothetical protein